MTDFTQMGNEEAMNRFRLLAESNSQGQRDAEVDTIHQALSRRLAAYDKMVEAVKQHGLEHNPYCRWFDDKPGLNYCNCGADDGNAALAQITWKTKQ